MLFFVECHIVETGQFSGSSNIIKIYNKALKEILVGYVEGQVNDKKKAAKYLTGSVQKYKMLNSNKTINQISKELTLEIAIRIAKKGAEIAPFSINRLNNRPNRNHQSYKNGLHHFFRMHIKGALG